MKKLLITLRSKWPEYLLEILVLIIGIYGAFALDNWNDDRKSRMEEMSYYCKLLDDFEIDRKNIALRYAESQYKIEISKKLLLEIENEAKDKEYLINAYIQGLRTNAFIPSKTAITDITSSGNLNLLTNDALKNDLLRYYAELDNLLFQLELNRNKTLERAFAYENDLDFGFQYADYAMTSLGPEVLSVLPNVNWQTNKQHPIFRQFQDDLAFFVVMSEREKQHFNKILEVMQQPYEQLQIICSK